MLQIAASSIFQQVLFRTPYSCINSGQNAKQVGGGSYLLKKYCFSWKTKTYLEFACALKEIRNRIKYFR